MASIRRSYGPNVGRTGSASPDGMVDLAAQIGSRQLLLGQLRSGQHSLGADAFWDRVRELRAEGYL